jgi:hypothetical protein
LLGKVESRITRKKPVMGLRDPPYGETHTRDFGLYPWRAFCMEKSQYRFGYDKGWQKPPLPAWLIYIIFILLAFVFMATYQKIFKQPHVPAGTPIYDPSEEIR